MFDQTGVGKETKIPYYADYDYYKHWILLAKSRNPDWGDSLFARWDAEVFSEHNKSARHAAPDSGGEEINFGNGAEDMARDMEALELDLNDSEKEIASDGFLIDSDEVVR